MSEKKPEIRFEGFEDEWKVNKFNEFAQLINGRAYKQSELLNDGKYKVLRVGNFYTNDSWYYSNLQLNDKYYANYGDLLYTWSASFGPHIWEGDTVIYHYHIWKIVLDKGMDQQFVRTLLNYDKAKILNDSSGSTMVHITKSGMENKLFQIPSIREQESIGNYFKKLDKQISNKQKELDKLQQFKQAMLQKMFPKEGETVPEIRFEGFGDEWSNYSLNEVAEIVGGGTPSTNIEEYWNGHINWYSPNEIINSRYAYSSKKKITEVGLNKSSAKILPAHRTILFTSRATIGEMAILKNKAATNQGFQSLIIRKQFDVNFVYSMGFQIKNIALNMSSGSTFLEISGKTLGKINIRIPNLTEQKLIGKYFSELDKQIINKEKELDKLKQFKQAMLDKMFV